VGARPPALFVWLAAGGLIGLAAGAIDALAVDKDLWLGLDRLAAERALAAVGVLVAAGVVGALLAGFGARLGRAFTRDATRPAAWLLALAGRGAGLLVIACAFGWTVRGGIPDARVPDLLSRARSARGPNLLLVVLDTVRADRLSSYGYARPTTPELDAFAHDAIRYERFWSTAPWTLPGHASLFTGAYPMRHGATQEHAFLDRRFATLGEVLRDAGFATFAASANPIVGPYTGLDQGFANFVETWRIDGGEKPPGTTLDPVTLAFERFLARQPRERPFFAFLNYMEAHFPYTPPAELRERFARRPVDAKEADRVGRRLWFDYYLDGPWPAEEMELRSDLYDAELARLSAEIGRLLDILRRDGRYDATVIAITSDHGEQFGEHGLVEHAFSLYEPLLRVPLLLRIPGGGARRGYVDERPGQLVDLPGTLLGLCGVEAAPLAAEGVNLLDPSSRREEVIAEYDFPYATLGWIGIDKVVRAGPRIAPYLRRLRSLLLDGQKLVWSSDGRSELYDLRDDPGELRDLLASRDPGADRELRARLAAAIERFAEPRATARPRPDPRFAGLAANLDAETAARLRELGYLF
jgi:arylsulfatase A-like enzyme